MTKVYGPFESQGSANAFASAYLERAESYAVLEGFDSFETAENEAAEDTLDPSEPG